MTRSALPVLTYFWFKGVSEYLEDFVARIDAPLLDILSITFNQIDFENPQLIRFINRTRRLKTLETARVTFADRTIKIELSQTAVYRSLNVGISCRELDWQLSSPEQVCTPSFLSAVENLYICGNQPSLPDRQDDFENAQWLGILHPFTAAKNLHLSEQFVPRIALALEELDGGRMTEILPILRNIFLEGL